MTARARYLCKERHLYMHKLDCFGQIRAWAVKSFALAMTRLQAATRRDVGIAPYTVIASPMVLRILIRIRAKQSSGICKDLDATAWSMWNRGLSMRTKIIGIEGIDGAGKTVQFDMLAKRLEAEGSNVLRLSFPRYDGFFGREIGRMLTGEAGRRADTVDAGSMALWYALDRFQALKDIDINIYDYCLINRYVLSNMAYQGLRLAGGEPGGRAFAEAARWIYALEHEALGLPVPDMYIFLQVDAAVSGRNVDSKGSRDYAGEGRDIYESDAGFLERVGAAYLSLCGMYGARVLPCINRGEMINPEIIHEAIYDLINIH